MVCASCGTENPARAKFCLECAAPLAAAAAPREMRKTVTVVFCDITGSTSMGESIDPEALRAVLARYFAEMKAIVERYGGTVEKFIGDAVMAVFGVPVIHEDDAARAVRAAAEMRAALPELGVQARIGVNTGEVVAGTDETLVTGDAVNVAARLEQAAPPGEVYLGSNTVDLVRGAAEVERVEPLRLKGKSEPVEVYRLVEILSDPARRLGGVFVGRERELQLLRQAFDLAVSDQVCQLFTLLGVAGVGKSRLVAEAVRDLDATIVRGRCLPYGECITYWPVVEAVKQLRPEERELEDRIAQPLEALLGGSEVTSKEEIAFAVRRLLEEAALERPLVVLWDDLHWAEEAFLDLVEHIADWARGAPILLLCMARPELLDRRSGWAGGKLHATTLLLEPLGREASDQLLGDLAGEVSDTLRARILGAAEGNPLFVEEMVAMLEASPEGAVAVPPSIQALLAARLDQLPERERAALERGAVEGQVFHRSAVQAMVPDDGEVSSHLLRLVRKELVRPERARFPDDDAFRFRHILIRDAAYDAVPKATRADLHELFAAWLEERGTDLVELDEIAGYHLERAYGYLCELGLAGDRARSLAERASARLAAAAHGASARDDALAAASLLERSVELLEPGGPVQAQRVLELAQARFDTDDLHGSLAAARDALGWAQTLGDERLAALAGLALVAASLQIEPEASAEEAIAETQRLLAVLTRAGEEHDLARAWALQSRLLFYLGRAEEAGASCEHARDLAHRVGDRRIGADVVMQAVASQVHGATPALEALRFVDEMLGQQLDPASRSFLLQKRSRLAVMRGDLAEARANYDECRTIALDYGMRLRRGVQTQDGASLELAAGDPVAAERELREGYEILAELGETSFRSTVAAYLANALVAQGRLEEAALAAEDAIALAQHDDFDTIARASAAKALIAAARGDAKTAKSLIQQAVRLMEGTDYLQRTADTYVVQAHVCRSAGETASAVAAARKAIVLYERKGDIARAARTQALLGSLSVDHGARAN